MTILTADVTINAYRYAENELISVAKHVLNDS